MAIGPPREAIGAIVMSRERVLHGTVGGIEERHRSVCRGGGEVCAVGLPSEVDRIVVESGCPMFSQLHERGGI